MLTTRKNKKGYEVLSGEQVLFETEKKLSVNDLTAIYNYCVKVQEIQVNRGRFLAAEDMNNEGIGAKLNATRNFVQRVKRFKKNPDSVLKSFTPAKETGGFFCF